MAMSANKEKSENDDDVQEINNTPFYLKNLKFINPGPALEDFVPEQSLRQERKLRRMMQQNAKTKLGKKSMYDDGGLLVADGRDLCDCMRPRCPGCFYPCNNCRSTKCGFECRCMRKWHYENLEVENGETRNFPEKKPS